METISTLLRLVRDGTATIDFLENFSHSAWEFSIVLRSIAVVNGEQWHKKNCDAPASGAFCFWAKHTIPQLFAVAIAQFHNCLLISRALMV